MPRPHQPEVPNTTDMSSCERLVPENACILTSQLHGAVICQAIDMKFLNCTPCEDPSTEEHAENQKDQAEQETVSIKKTRQETERLGEVDGDGRGNSITGGRRGIMQGIRTERLRRLG